MSNVQEEDIKRWTAKRNSALGMKTPAEAYVLAA